MADETQNETPQQATLPDPAQQNQGALANLFERYARRLFLRRCLTTSLAITCYTLLSLEFCLVLGLKLSLFWPSLILAGLSLTAATFAAVTLWPTRITGHTAAQFLDWHLNLGALCESSLKARSNTHSAWFKTQVQNRVPADPAQLINIHSPRKLLPKNTPLIVLTAILILVWILKPEANHLQTHSTPWQSARKTGFSVLVSSSTQPNSSQQKPIQSPEPRLLSIQINLDGTGDDSSDQPDNLDDLFKAPNPTGNNESDNKAPDQTEPNTGVSTDHKTIDKNTLQAIKDDTTPAEKNTPSDSRPDSRPDNNTQNQSNPPKPTKSPKSPQRNQKAGQDLTTPFSNLATNHPAQSGTTSQDSGHSKSNPQNQGSSAPDASKNQTSKLTGTAIAKQSANSRQILVRKGQLSERARATLSNYFRTTITTSQPKPDNK